MPQHHTSPPTTGPNAKMRHPSKLAEMWWLHTLHNGGWCRGEKLTTAGDLPDCKVTP